MDCIKGLLRIIVPIAIMVAVIAFIPAVGYPVHVVAMLSVIVPGLLIVHCAVAFVVAKMVAVILLPVPLAYVVAAEPVPDYHIHISG